MAIRLFMNAIPRCHFRMPESHSKHRSHHGYGHGHRKESNASSSDFEKRRDREGIKTWCCCSCNETVQSLELNANCSNGECQHARCDSCSLDDYAMADRVWFPPSQGASSSSVLKSLDLSKGTTEKLAHLNRLKKVYQATFDEAAKKHGQESFPIASDSGTSTLERYLYHLIRPTEFVFAWEWSILPFLVEIIPKFLGRGYAINVTRDPTKNSAQTICLMTQVKSTRTQRILIARHVLDMIPDRFYKNTSFQFCHGTVEFAQRGSDKKHPDDVCDAKNPHFYMLPMMGDSIGPSTEECAGTLGPCVKFGDQHFWLANLHVFLKQLKNREASAQQYIVLHPGLLDKGACGHKSEKSHVSFGTLCGCSGNDLTTTRPSSHPFWQIFPESTPHDVVTDWVLIDDFGHTELSKENGKEKEAPFLNTLRIPGAGNGDPFITVTKLSPVLPEAKVHTTGRTSGYQYGQICEIPAYLDADASRNTIKPTREWYIEQSSWIAGSEESWLESGIGIPGDSGAPVIDSDNNSLYGQIWGRNKYWGPGPRVAYFTAMADISDDIQAKYPELKSALELPQCSSRKRTLDSELYCRECAYPEENATQHSNGDGSDEVSVMSISSASEYNSLFDSSPNLNALESTSADGHPPDLQLSDMIQSDSDELMSTDSGNAHLSFSPIDQEEFEDILELLPPTNAEHALEMALDPYQFYNNSDHEFGVNDETLSIDEEGMDEDNTGRSSAHRKNLHYNVPREKLPGSWVMVRSKPKDTTKNLSKVASRRTILPRKETPSLLRSLVRTTEASGRSKSRTHTNTL